VLSTLDYHSYVTLLNPFPKPWYCDQARKTLKRETDLNQNLVKNYKFGSKNAAKQRFAMLRLLLSI